jgi:hypothetical protein
LKKITLSDGRTIAVKCLSCSIVERVVQPNGGTIYESKFFHAHQDVAYPIKSLVILASKRLWGNISDSYKSDPKYKKAAQMVGFLYS